MTDYQLSFDLIGEQAMKDYGKLLGSASQGRGVFYLYGRLGAGKTTIAKGILNGAGYYGVVRSPTFSLMECYDLPNSQGYHVDLYRLKDPEEMFFIGGKDYLTTQNLCIIEWPEKGEGWLPPEDIKIEIQYAPDRRKILITPAGSLGNEILQKLR